MKDYTLMLSGGPDAATYEAAGREIAAGVKELGGRVVDEGVLDDGVGRFVNFRMQNGADVELLFGRPTALTANLRMTLLGFG